jgi:bifunctional ADP-heptose synthase (sugar kinase/adenylyltransferase)
MIENDIDIVFSNAAELKSLFETKEFETGLNELRKICDIAAVTKSEEGSVVLTPDTVVMIPAQSVSRVVDTTGAGDLYASGFLFGLTRGWDLKACATLGNRCAAEIIMQLGARSMKPLRDLDVPEDQVAEVMADVRRRDEERFELQLAASDVTAGNNLILGNAPKPTPLTTPKRPGEVIGEVPAAALGGNS